MRDLTDLRVLREGLEDLGLLAEQMREDSPEWESIELIEIGISKVYERVCDEIRALENEAKRTALEDVR
jgi:hypothetical protein